MGTTKKRLDTTVKPSGSNRTMRKRTAIEETAKNIYKNTKEQSMIIIKPLESTHNMRLLISTEESPKTK